MPSFQQQIKDLLPQEELNPKLWDNGKLDSEVRHNLFRIAVDFAKEANINLSDIKDIIITGSSANYNWSKYSDIDLHLVVEYDDFSDNSELISDYFFAKKKIWNDEHDITIHDHEVEVYIQDEDEPHYASGVYSLKNKEWIHKPEHISIKNLDKNSVIKKTKALSSIIDSIEDLYKEGDYDKAYNASKRMKDKLRKLRSHGLESGGEFSVENLAYKLLRRKGSLEKLSNVYNDSYDKMLSV